jgi:hypothetical protein
VFGQAVVFTAAVSAVAPASGTPTGTVTFKEGSTTLGTATLAGGTAPFTTSALSVGTHSITATYGGDSNFEPGTSAAFSQAVNKAATATVLISSANPSIAGQSVTFGDSERGGADQAPDRHGDVQVGLPEHSSSPAAR